MPPNFLTIIIFYYFCRYSYKLDKNMQKRKTYLSLVALLLTGWVSAQSNSVGINTDTPNESAALHISPLKGKAREAKITATIANGKVTGLNIVDKGYGYTSAPEIFIAGGGPSALHAGERATATATLDSNGSISSITLTSGGDQYVATPSVSIIPKGDALGWVLPRVDLQNLSDSNAPIKIESTDTDADGLLVYNNGSNDNLPYIYWFEKNKMKWHEVVDVFGTPKISLFSFKNDINDMDLSYNGKYPYLSPSLFKEPISNISGIEIYDKNVAKIKLPRKLGTYFVEVNLNLTTKKTSTDYPLDSTTPCGSGQGNGAPCSKAVTSTGENIMGYFIHIDYDNFLKDGETKKDQPALRKESPIIAKVGAPHSLSAVFVFEITSLTSSSEPYLSFRLGRMQGGTNYNPVTVLAEGSFIKIQYLKG